MKTAPRHGFTLIELAIVLVIIGLLASGILVGRDLIKAAEIRKQIAQIHNFDLAAGAFRNKYNCIPGDCPFAVEIGLGTDAEPGADGNGDGLVDTDDVFTNLRWVGLGESANFWYHLSRAGMIDKNDVTGSVYALGPFMRSIPGYTTPEPVLATESETAVTLGSARSFGKRGGIAILPLQEAGPSPMLDFTELFGTNSKNAWFIVDTLAATTVDATMGVYYAPTAFALDSKMDDGKPRSGIMRAVTNGWLFWNVPVYTEVGPTCITTPADVNSQYDLKVTTGKSHERNAVCSLIILSNF